MKTIFILSLLMNSILFMSCASNPNKPTEQDTTLDRSQEVGNDLSLGLNKKGEVVTSKKTELSNYLKALQQEVIQYETEIYGSEELGRNGLYGELRMCLDKGKELQRLPEKSILTKDERNLSGKMIIDEKNKLVSVSEEYLLERVKRFEGYRDLYEKQKEDFQERIRICKNQ